MEMLVVGDESSSSSSAQQQQQQHQVVVDTSGGGGGGIPVFVFPSSLLFNVFLSSGEDATTSSDTKQILTIYNPYDFPIKFRVLSTSPGHYKVLDSEGSIRAKNCVDLIIRLTLSPNTTTSLTTPTTHESKFRVQIYNLSTRALLGKKDVSSTIVISSLEQQQQHRRSIITSSSTSQQQQSRSHDNQHSRASSSSSSGEYYGGGRVGGPNYVAMVIGVICILALMLPTAGDPPTPLLPSYTHLSVNQKLLFAYTLGLVTMVLFRY